MQNAIRKPAVKIAAFVLSAVTLVVSVLGVLGFFICMNEGFYTYNASGAADHSLVSRAADSRLLQNIYRSEAPQAVTAYTSGTDSFQEFYAPNQTNLRVSIQQITGGELGSEVFSYDPAAEAQPRMRNYYVVERLDDYGIHSYFETTDDSSIFQRYDEIAVDSAEIAGEEEEGAKTEMAPQAADKPVCRFYIVKMGIAENLAVHDQIALVVRSYNWLYGARFSMIWVITAAVVLGLAAHIVMLAGAGRRPGQDAVCPGWQEKIPLDLYAAVSVTAIVCIIAVLMELDYYIVYNGTEFFMALSCFGILLAVMAVLTEMLLGTLAVRLKMGRWWRSCLIWRMCRWVCGLAVRLWNAVFGRIFRAARGFFQALPLVWKGLVGTCMILFLEFFLSICLDTGSGFMMFIWLVFNLAVVFGAAYLLAQMRKLSHAGKKMADGDLDFRVNTEGMIPIFQEHGENLNAISAGMSHAVDERMRSERMKTELITNVSHDIKTPLTSIVNYVDLLSKEEEGNERVKDYISALQRQSSRLRKLIEDLVEASKASTGSLSVDLQPCELGVLLSQTAGEYEERLQSLGLSLVVKAPEEPVMVMADSRHIWRVLDNLMGNICKYALPGTRVYMTLTRKDEAVMTLRNISREELGMSEEELMERFVRGDSSRSTEGSGLGLSIARSLMELQHGKMSLEVDGDLFKVILRMPLLDGEPRSGVSGQPVESEPHLEITPLEMPVQREKEQQAVNRTGREPDPRLSWNIPPKAPEGRAYLKRQRKEKAVKEGRTLDKMVKSPAKWLYGKLKFIAESEDE